MPALKQRVGAWLIPRLPLSRRAFDILRFELNAFQTRVVGGLSLVSRRRIRQWRKQRGLQLNLGGGPWVEEGWISLDIGAAGYRSLPWDIRRGLPFADATVARVYASHVLEHLDFRHEAPALLVELRRVLEPGGAIRIVVPDVERYLAAYVNRDIEQWAGLGYAQLPEDMPTRMAMINHVFHQGGEHKFGYDYATLEWMLMSKGLNSRRSEYRLSPLFPASLDLECHARYSLYVDVIKT